MEIWMLTIGIITSGKTPREQRKLLNRIKIKRDLQR